MKVTIKVAAIIFNEKGEILLLKERYKKGGDLKWNIVKGTYDNARETIVECIKREIKEEVGLTAEDVVLKKIYHYGDDANSRLLFIFFVNKFEGSASPSSILEQNRRQEDIIDINWFNKDGLKNIPEDEYVATYVFHILKDIDFQLDKNIEVLRIDDV